MEIGEIFLVLALMLGKAYSETAGAMRLSPDDESFSNYIGDFTLLT